MLKALRTAFYLALIALADLPLTVWAHVWALNENAVSDQLYQYIQIVYLAEVFVVVACITFLFIYTNDHLKHEN